MPTIYILKQTTIHQLGFIDLAKKARPLMSLSHRNGLSIEKKGKELKIFPKKKTYFGEHKTWIHKNLCYANFT